ncbi:hypothetical protein ABB27_15610 [Stenotrophomonas terrae]|uniref:Transmembrane protein n=1 Tax=Stenotrophomonas terrae TaxID=405446 RepID=A0A0R0C7Z4_9GAMM|nr:hypothetical protein [Stenotrophomonas terrae]KRG65424.1 hypothetical protein ABB27_15610 [Stenotrophomonas terrae]
MKKHELLYARLRRTAMVWLAVYPTVLLVLMLLRASAIDFRHWPLPLRALGTTLIVVPIVVNISAPLVEALVAKIMRHWLHYRRSRLPHQ